MYHVSGIRTFFKTEVGNLNLVDLSFLFSSDFHCVELGIASVPLLKFRARSLFIFTKAKSVWKNSLNGT